MRRHTPAHLVTSLALWAGCTSAAPDAGADGESCLGCDTDTAPDDADDAAEASDSDSGDGPTDVDPSDPDSSDDADDTDADSSDGSGDADAVDTDPQPDVDPAAPWVQIGTGFADAPWEGYVPLNDGDDALITEGPQGGYHVWGGFEARNLPAGDVSAVWSLTGLGDQAIGGAFATMSTVPYGDHEASAGITVFIDFAFDVTTLEGQPAQLCAELTVSDVVVSDCVGIVMRCCDYLE